MGALEDITGRLIAAGLPPKTRSRVGWEVVPGSGLDDVPEPVAVCMWYRHNYSPPRAERLSGLTRIVEALVGHWSVQLYGCHFQDGGYVSVLVYPLNRDTGFASAEERVQLSLTGPM